MEFFFNWLEAANILVDGMNKQDVFRSVVTLFSVLLGASLAYANQNRVVNNKQKIENINACQRALFFLGQLQENLNDIKQELEEFRQLDSRHTMLSNTIHGQEKVNFESSSLTFLLYENEPNLVYKLAMMEREYYKLLSIKNRRNELLAHLLDEQSLTSLEDEQCKHYTDKLYHQFKRCYTFNSQVQKEALIVFKNKFKKANFVVGVVNVMNR